MEAISAATFDVCSISERLSVFSDVDFRDPLTKSMKQFSPGMLALWWAVLLILFVYSSVGEVIFHNVKLHYGEQTDYSGDTYMGSNTVCAWSPTWDLIHSAFFRTWWCISIGMFVWVSLAGQAGPFGAALGMNFWTPIARLTFGVRSPTSSVALLAA